MEELLLAGKIQQFNDLVKNRVSETLFLILDLSVRDS